MHVLTETNSVLPTLNKSAWYSLIFFLYLKHVYVNRIGLDFRFSDRVQQEAAGLASAALTHATVDRIAETLD